MAMRVQNARNAFKAKDAYMSLVAHQSVEVASLAGGAVSNLHGDLLPLYQLQNYDCPAFATAFALATLYLACVCSGLPSPEPKFCFLLGLGSCLTHLAASSFSIWAELMFVRFERARERWEVSNYPEGEIKEMTMIYISRGFNPEDAVLVAKTLSRYPEFWIDHMLVQEIGLNTHIRVQSHTDVARTVAFCSTLTCVITFAACYSTILGYALSIGTLVTCIWLSCKVDNFLKSRYSATLYLLLWQTFVAIASAVLA